jgi:hypothetical protein
MDPLHAMLLPALILIFPGAKKNYQKARGPRKALCLLAGNCDDRLDVLPARSRFLGRLLYLKKATKIIMGVFRSVEI